MSPKDTVELLLAPDGPGTTLRFIWRSPSPPNERGVALTRQRLNQKLAGDLREWLDTGSRVVREPPPPRD